MSKNITPRQLRRMEERRLRKQNRKTQAPSAVIASKDRSEVNRENAQHSTGPRSLAGKAISSQNAIRHGLTGTFCVLPGEDQDAYLLLHTELLCEHDPATATEELLVSDMVRHYWLTQRAMRLQEEVMTRDLNDPLVMKQLALFLRYQTTNQRAFHKCMADLQKLKKIRKKEERELAELDAEIELGFVSQSPKAAGASAAATGIHNSENGFVSQNESSNKLATGS